MNETSTELQAAPDLEDVRHGPPPRAAAVASLLGGIATLIGGGIVASQTDVFGNSLINQPNTFWVTAFLYVTSACLLVTAGTFAWLRKRYAAAVRDSHGPGPSAWSVLLIALALIVLCAGVAGYGIKTQRMVVFVPLKMSHAKFAWDPAADRDPAACFSLRPASAEPLAGYEQHEVAGETIYVSPKSIITAEHLTFVNGMFSPPGSSSTALSLHLNDTGAAALQAWTAAHTGERIAIMLDGAAHGAPRVNGAIGRQIQVSGNWSVEETLNTIAAIRQFDRE